MFQVSCFIDSDVVHITPYDGIQSILISRKIELIILKIFSIDGVPHELDTWMNIRWNQFELCHIGNVIKVIWAVAEFVPDYIQYCLWRNDAQIDHLSLYCPWISQIVWGSPGNCVQALRLTWEIEHGSLKIVPIYLIPYQIHTTVLIRWIKGEFRLGCYIPGILDGIPVPWLTHRKLCLGTLTVKDDCKRVWWFFLAQIIRASPFNGIRAILG